MTSHSNEIRKKANDTKWYLEQYKSNECLCGRPKKPKLSFCYKCYSSLPPDMQRALYQKFYAGYEEAVDEAVEWLKAWEW